MADHLDQLARAVYFMEENLDKSFHLGITAREAGMSAYWAVFIRSRKSGSRVTMFWDVELSMTAVRGSNPFELFGRRRS